MVQPKGARRALPFYVGLIIVGGKVVVVCYQMPVESFTVNFYFPKSDLLGIKQSPVIIRTRKNNHLTEDISYSKNTFLLKGIFVLF